MFNKTAINRKEKSYKIYKAKPKLNKSRDFKKSLTNLKISFVITNNNNSSNNSNIQLKTSNSKITVQSASIRKVQTHKQAKMKKSLFEEKEKEKETYQTSRKVSSSTKSNIITNTFYNNSYSAKNKINYNKSRIYFKTQDNKEQDNKSKAYYLAGELPFRDKYIIETKDYNNTSNNNNKNDNDTRNKKLYNNRNELFQCDSFHRNIYSYNVLKDKMLNMRKKDKKIEKLAKKLAIKLNLEDSKKNNHTKCGCGNLITLKNGFFNGVNLVMNYSPIREKKTSNKETNTGENIGDNEAEVIYSNGYNFIPTNLPLFLRDKCHIKGTTVLSPFCIEARDEFLFKKIFYNGEKERLKNRDVIDNKFNIIYAENQKQYDKSLMKFNEKLKAKGRRILHEVGPTPIEGKLNIIKNKMNFMKKIVDYAYPNMVLARVRESEKFYKKKSLSQCNLPPFKKAEIKNKKNNKYLGDYLKESIKIRNNFL